MKKKAASAPKTMRLSTTLETTILGIDSSWEEVTQLVFDYRDKNGYPQLASRGYALSKCQGALARRIYASREAAKPNVVFVTGAGHGGYAVFTGAFFDPVFQVGGYDPAEASGKIVHLLSCETARDLGPNFVSNGCRAYFGYDEDFVLVTEDTDRFFACDSEIDFGFVDGLTAAEVYARAIAAFDKNIEELRAAGRNYSAAVMQFNRDHLRSPNDGPAWGDPSAKL